ncbi:hypothetical protein RHEC894_CH03264 [Rhizobium sp. CIAT894]|nr:hypothetical protein RHEC894_CH03264 [Rhizobium sp. CIAT894]
MRNTCVNFRSSSEILLDRITGCPKRKGSMKERCYGRLRLASSAPLRDCIPEEILRTGIDAEEGCNVLTAVAADRRALGFICAEEW